ncbi:hypothetical protein [Rufibacter latericius]|uniref:TraB/GumN family protein n=1 Tax=Rufibacter latericius TaxID=2487040 RepID=A0A3M9MJF8_9BACT|nr:hypothetical protein [Rufibacter latericius]RNI25644.1 hypothetical protein EFB08_12345 [Rufibacter latericius]
MKLFLRLLPILFLLFLSSRSMAQPAASECDSRLLSYKDWKETCSTQWTLSLGTPESGNLQYIGASHSTDPVHEQFAQIEMTWDIQQPTLVFFEGPNRGTSPSEDETIREMGESGFVRFLAQADGIKTQSLEMSPQDEVDQLLKTGRFSKEQVKLFFLLREASRLRDRKNLNEEQLKAAIGQLLPKANSMIKGFDQVIPDVASLQVAYQKYWTSPANWWEAPANWFTPTGDGQETGGKFTHEINRLNSENRDLHMYRLLSEAVLRGERVLAVVGRNHVPMQAEALKCALSKKNQAIK